MRCASALLAVSLLCHTSQAVGEESTATENGQKKEPPAQVTHLQWPGGALPLAQTAKWLGESSNKTTISGPKKQSSPNDDVEFPFITGSYWEGVITAMEHHNLALDLETRAITFDHGEGSGTGVQYPVLGINPVQLKVQKKNDVERDQPFPRNRFIPCGPVLLEIKDARLSRYVNQRKSSIELGYFAHLEPRFTQHDIGYVAVTWKPLGQGNTTIPWPQQISTNQQQRAQRQISSSMGRQLTNVLRSESSSLLNLHGLDLHAHCDIAFTELRSSEHSLGVGGKASFHMDDSNQEWTMNFLGPSERRTRYHRLELSVPNSEKYQGDIRIKASDKNGKRIRSSGSSIDWSSKSKRLNLVTYLQAPKSLPITFKIEVQAVLSKARYNISSHLDFP